MTTVSLQPGMNWTPPANCDLATVKIEFCVPAWNDGPANFLTAKGTLCTVNPGKTLKLAPDDFPLEFIGGAGGAPGVGHGGAAGQPGKPGFAADTA